MKFIEENFETEVQFVRKLFFSDLLVAIICTIIAIIGYFLHSMGVFSFFIMLSGLCLMLMILIGAERYEIHNKYNGKYKEQ
jgi:hypothetical protein